VYIKLYQAKRTKRHSPQRKTFAQLIAHDKSVRYKLWCRLANRPGVINSSPLLLILQVSSDCQP